MMMAQQKHLHELLKEDQEPFQLKNYIADRCCQLKAASKTQGQVINKRKPISQSTKFPSNFCKNACFFSFHDSPDRRKTPLFEFPSTGKAKSPCRSPNAIFLHIPARTAALLLEAAVRIQKQSSKQKNQSKKNAFGLFGSIRRKLTHRSRNRKHEESGHGVKVSVKDILRWDSSVGRRKASDEEENMVGVEEFFETSAPQTGMRCSCSCSAVWSERNEDNKSFDLDIETSCSSQSDADDDDFEEQEMESTDFATSEKRFCESPFRFVLLTSPPHGRRTPDFSSPAASPIRHSKEDKETHEKGIPKKFQVEADDEEEEEKEQCSPVSVLDPPFEDDDEEHQDEDENEDDLECSYAIVQNAKKKLLYKLRRFEKLAELDPIELEKRIWEQERDDNENDTYNLEQEEEFGYHECALSDKQKDVTEFVQEVLSKSSFHHLQRIPEDMTRLVADLIAEEEREQNWSADKGVVVKRVCRRLDSWKEVESNTIDMMVEQDLGRESLGWKTYQDQVGDTALAIELAILGLLMEELSDELVV